MREQFEIITTSDLTEVRDSERVRYMLNDGDTMLTLSTNDPSITEKLLVSKYRNASIKITITVEHDDMEYKDIQPWLEIPVGQYVYLKKTRTDRITV